jgi:hypothetical protein
MMATVTQEAVLYAKKSVSILYIYTVFDLHRWCNGWRARLECSRSWDRTPVVSNL